MSRTWRLTLPIFLFAAYGAVQLLDAQTASPRQAFHAPARIGAVPEFLHDRGVVRLRAVEIEPNLFDHAAAKRVAADLASGRPLVTEMNFFDNASFQVRWTGVGQGDDRNMLVWTGAVEGMPYSHAVMVVSDSLVSANIAPGDGRLFQIRSTEDGLRWVREVDQEQFPNGAAPMIPPPAGSDELRASTLASGQRAADAAPPAADDGSTIDVIVIYTPAVTRKAGGANAAQQLAALGIAETNLGYQNSGVVQRVRLVYSGEVQYTESGDYQTDLNRLTDPHDGYADVAHTLRDNYNADLVSMWADLGGAVCGVAWLLNDPNTPRPERGFSVVDSGCATGYYSFGHEMGHNMGANHAHDDNTGPGAYAYSFGYKQPSGSNPFRTIMAYACANSRCDRVNYWSNPSVNVNGQASGVAQGSSTSADNHLTLNNTRSVIANYRVSSGGGSGGASGLPESDHPYPNNLDKTYSYTLTGAAALAVTFDPRTSVENGYDFIYISDGNGNQISGSPFTGTSLASRTVTVPGSTVKIRLVTDSTMNDYGFKVTGVTATGAGNVPKLVVTSLTAPTTATIGTNLTGVTVSIVNQGSAAAGAFRLGFYYSRNRNVTTTDIFSGWYCTYDSGLAAGSTTSCNGQVGVPSALSPGVWYLAAIADDQNQVSQSDRSGNVRVADSGTITIGGGTPGELVQPVPGSILSSGTVTFQWSAGTGVSGYTLAIGTTPGGTDIYNRDQGTALSVTITGLPTNGASLYIRLTSRIGGGSMFKDYVVAAARLGGNLPALSITAFSAPTSATVGVNLHNISVTVANRGSGPANAFRIGFYYSRNSNVTTSDIFSGWYCTYPDGLPSGSNSTCTGDIGVPTTLASGTWYLAAIADDQHNLQQSDTSGNMRANDSGPLSVTGVSPANMLSPAPGSTFASSSVTFRWDSGSGADQYYIYIGSTPGGNDINAVDLGLTLSTTITGLPTDGSLLYVGLWTRFGDNWVTNNYTYRAFRAGAAGSAPMIAVTTFTAPVTGTVGVNLPGTRVVITNQGTANAGPFRLGYYYSKNKNVTTSDVFSGWFCNVTGGLAVGSTFTCSGEIGVPTSLSPGQWYLAVIADDLNQLPQADRSAGTRSADTGPLTLSANGASGGALPESSHPYANNTDKSWTYTAPGNPAAIKVTFDGSTSVEDGYDFIYIYDGTGLQIPFSPFTGTQLQNRTVIVTGATVRIRLVSDDSVNDYGFRVTSIKDAGALPKLVVTSFTAPTRGVAGVNLQGAQLTVVNQGTADAGPFEVEFYYGKTPNVSVYDIDSGWYCSLDNGLAAGASYSCGGDIGVPSSLTPGNWYVAAIADDLFAVDQSDRGGNVRVNDNGPLVISSSVTATDQAIHSDSGTNTSGVMRKRPDPR